MDACREDDCAVDAADDRTCTSASTSSPSSSGCAEIAEVVVVLKAAIKESEEKLLARLESLSAEMFQAMAESKEPVTSCKESVIASDDRFSRCALSGGRSGNGTHPGPLQKVHALSGDENGDGIQSGTLRRVHAESAGETQSGSLLSITSL